MNYITYEDFKKLEMRIGHIRFAEPVEGADKLLRCEVDFGPAVVKVKEAPENSEDQEESTEEVTESEEELIEPPFGKEEYTGRDVRQIVSGIREYYPEYESLVGKKVLYVVNLEPRTIRGVESHGMLMAVDGLQNQPVFIVPENDVEAGSSVR